MVLSICKQIMKHNNINNNNNNKNNTAIDQWGVPTDFTTNKFKHRISSTCSCKIKYNLIN